MTATRIPAEALADERLRALAALAQRRGVEAYLVGGTVRDMLLGGASPADIDVTVLDGASALARAFADEIGAAFVLLDETRDTARVVAPDGWTLDLAVAQGTLEEDLGQRDLTINAMAVDLRALDDPHGAPVIDPLGGLADLAKRVARVPSATVLDADPLRLLRVFRFAATLGLRIEPATLDAVGIRASRASEPAAERIARELFLTLAHPRAAATIRAMDDAGVLPAILPETRAMRDVPQNEYHHLDVWSHSLEALACLEDVLSELPSLAGEHAPRLQAFLGEQLVPQRPRTALLKLAVLLHDVGKPSTRRLKNGTVVFYTHARVGSEMMVTTCARLKLSAKETAEAVRYVDRHMVPGDLESSSPLADKRVLRFFRKEGEGGLALMLLSLADGLATRGQKADPERNERMREFVAEMIAAYYERAEARLTARPLVTGRELMTELDLHEGPELGRLLKHIRALQLEGDLRSHADAVAEARAVLARIRTD